VLKHLLAAMRPKQWTKNIFIFAALVFDEKLFIPAYLMQVVAGFILFCLLSSTVYLINDLADIEKDRQHPKKRMRPLASGALSPNVAKVAAALLLLIALPASFWLSLAFGFIALVYLALNLAYSFGLKNLVILDVLIVAAGYVLRVAAGTVIIPVERFSPWLYVCTTLGALFISFAKRRHELLFLEAGAEQHRASLEEYTVRLLDEMIVVTAATTIIAYSLYTFSAPNLPPNHSMMLTIPFVLYGVFRYLYLVHVKNEGGNPDEIFLKDLPLLLDILLWGVAVVVVMYWQ
jgi:4-hydroxybenzoate polyprenyltransferase